jgi:hypothetical protein
MFWLGARRRAAVALGAILLGSAAVAAVGAGASVSAIGKLEPGLWQLRDLDDTRAAQQSICVADPNLLLQLRHRNAACSRLVISDGPRGAVVHYTCETSGYGQTALRIETPRLAQIDTQGIAGNQPFAYRAEARRVGPCQSAAKRLR